MNVPMLLSIRHLVLSILVMYGSPFTSFMKSSGSFVPHHLKQEQGVSLPDLGPAGAPVPK